MRISDSIALITGGASGLGAAVAHMIVEAGGRAIIADRNAELGAALALELGANAAFAPTDVTDPAAVAAALSLARERFGGAPSIAVNCAGIAVAQRVLGKDGPMDLDAFRRVVEINLVGTFNVIRLACAAMASANADEAGERGVIVNTASVAAFEGQIGQAAYSASKGGVAAMTLPIARELARNGIRVVTIAPGIFGTPMLRGLPDEAQASLATQVPFPQRLGDPDEYARLVCFIAETGYMNGEVIRLDGAIRMGPK
jgi:NAD(P)-dependent dehydrogenase (short-subunit alcohol dehydrogenase family)